MFNQQINNLGTETAFSVLARADQLSRMGNNIINLGIGQPDFKTPTHIVEAGIKALKDGHHGYTPSLGIIELRESVKNDIFKRYKTNVEIDLIQIVPGGKPIMFIAMLILGGKNNEILTPDPGFPIYQSAINFSGARSIPYKLDEKSGFSLNADEIISKITKNTRLIILNSPANPTGGVNNQNEIEKLLNFIEKYPDLYILSDEIYDRLIFDKKPTSLLSYENIRDKLIVLNGWSKTYAMTGWRIGYGIWPKKLIEFADKLAVNYHSCVNAATQYAAIAALNGDQSSVNNMRDAFIRRSKLITNLINDIDLLSCQNSKGAFYNFVNIKKTKMTSLNFQNTALEKFGVACIAGTSFGKFGEGFVRFSCANSDNNIKLAMKRVSEMLQMIKN